MSDGLIIQKWFDEDLDAPGAAAPASQPLWLAKGAIAQAIAAEEIRQPAHDLLHRYRTGYQTVGQPWQLFFRQPLPTFEPERIAPVLADLFPFRQYAPAAVTTYQPLWSFYRYKAPTEIPEQIPAPKSDLFDYRKISTAPAVGAPAGMWRALPPLETIAEVVQQPDHNGLHRFRVGYQTVGQPRLLQFQQCYPPAVEPERIAPARTDLFPFRQYAPVAAAAFQPIWRWSGTKVATEVPEVFFARAPDLFAYRRPTATAVTPVYGWGARSKVGSSAGRDPSTRIGSGSASGSNGKIGSEDA